MFKVRIKKTVGVLIALLLIVSMSGCIRAKPARERDPLPTVVPEATVDVAVEAEEIAQAEEPVDLASEETAEEPPVADAEEEPVAHDGPVHVVVLGDTWASIAARHGTTVEGILSANGLKGSSILVIGQELRLPTDAEPVAQEEDESEDKVEIENAAVHIVKYGETLGQIAQRYRMPIDEVMSLNPWLTNPHLLRPGAELTVVVAPIPPDATVHTVRAGETLDSIAQRYGVSYQNLARVNHINDANRLDVGQVLVIPE